MGTEKLTNEEKAKIFGMYLKCKYVAIDELPKKVGGIAINAILQNRDKMKRQLLLTSLSSITDEDAIEVAKIAGVHNEEDKVKEMDYSHQFICRNEFGIHLNYWHKTSHEYNEYEVYPFTIHPNGEASDHMGNCNNTSLIFQYLTSKGYAVPLFFGIDHWANGKTAIELNIAIEKPQ